MMILQAVLVKRETDDGLMAFHDEVELGRRYLVDLDRLERQVLMRHDHPDGREEFHRKDLIPDVEGYWLPLECLRLEVA